MLPALDDRSHSGLHEMPLPEHLPVVESQCYPSEGRDCCIPTQVAHAIRGCAMVRLTVDLDHEPVADHEIHPTDARKVNLCTDRQSGEHQEDAISEHRFGSALGAGVRALDEGPAARHSLRDVTKGSHRQHPAVQRRLEDCESKIGRLTLQRLDETFADADQVTVVAVCAPVENESARFGRPIDARAIVRMFEVPSSVAHDDVKSVVRRPEPVDRASRDAAEASADSNRAHDVGVKITGRVPPATDSNDAPGSRGAADGRGRHAALPQCGDVGGAPELPNLIRDGEHEPMLSAATGDGLRTTPVCGCDAAGRHCGEPTPRAPSAPAPKSAAGAPRRASGGVARRAAVSADFRNSETGGVSAARALLAHFR